MRKITRSRDPSASAGYLMRGSDPLEERALTLLKRWGAHGVHPKGYQAATELARDLEIGRDRALSLQNILAAKELI